MPGYGATEPDSVARSESNLKVGKLRAVGILALALFGAVAVLKPRSIQLLDGEKANPNVGDEAKCLDGLHSIGEHGVDCGGICSNMCDCSTPSVTHLADDGTCEFKDTDGTVTPPNSWDNAGFFNTGAWNGKGMVTPDAAVLQGDVYQEGENDILFTAIDGHGNEAKCKMVVKVTDKQKPTEVNACPADSSPSVDAQCNVNTTWTTPGFTDNCEGLTGDVDSTVVSKSFSGLQGEKIVYKVTDKGGQIASCEFTITPTDVSKPTIYGKTGDFEAMTDSPFLLPTLEQSGDKCVEGLHADTFTTDKSFESLVRSEISDNCDSQQNLTLTYEPPLPEDGMFKPGNETYTVTVTDQGNNAATGSMQVHIVDMEAPKVVKCPTEAYEFVVPNNTHSAEVTWSEDVVDFIDNDCAKKGAGENGLYKREFNDPDKEKKKGDMWRAGSYTVKYVAKDAADLTAECTFVVNVKDVQAPTLTGCPSDGVVTINNLLYTSVGIPGFHENDDKFPKVTANDVVDGDVDVKWTPSAVTPSDGSYSLAHHAFPVGSTFMVAKATDEAGNVAECKFEVKVLDEEDPYWVDQNPACENTTSVFDYQQCGGDVIVATDMTDSHNYVSDPTGPYDGPTACCDAAFSCQAVHSEDICKTDNTANCTATESHLRFAQCLPTLAPSASPSVRPSASPTRTPSANPTTLAPSASPSGSPTTMQPSASPSAAPTLEPSANPTTVAPSASPSGSPTTLQPTLEPSTSPTTGVPTVAPSKAPTSHPCDDGSHGCDKQAGGNCIRPKDEATGLPALNDFACECKNGWYCVKGCDSPHTDHKCQLTLAPSANPTTLAPTAAPSASPTKEPSANPTTKAPSASPSGSPTTVAPSASPSGSPTTVAPSASPSGSPTTEAPTTLAPSASPTTSAPSLTPTAFPTMHPCSTAGDHDCDTVGGDCEPADDNSSAYSCTCKQHKGYYCSAGCDGNTANHTCTLSLSPTLAPTLEPSANPTTLQPTLAPSANPTTGTPSASPSGSPTTVSPTSAPTQHPCDDGSHGCDKGDGGICTRHTTKPGEWTCSCANGYYCTANCATDNTELPDRRRLKDQEAHVCTATVSPTAHPSVSPTVSPSANPTTLAPTASPSVSPTLNPTETPTTSPTAAAFPPTIIDFNFEGHYPGISTTSVEDMTDSNGACPRGWTCTGVAQVKNEEYIADQNANYAGQQGQQYFIIGGDKTVGSATSAEFTLPSTAAKVQYFRMGGAALPSGFYVMESSDEPNYQCQNSDGGNPCQVCGPRDTAEEDTDIFFEQECDVSKAAGLKVYLFVQDKDTSEQMGKVMIDDIHFLDVNGYILGDYRMFWKRAESENKFEWQLPHKIASDMKCEVVVSFDNETISNFHMTIDGEVRTVDLLQGGVSENDFRKDRFVTLTVERTSGLVDFLVEGEDLGIDGSEMDGLISTVGFTPGGTLQVDQMNCQTFV